MQRATCLAWDNERCHFFFIHFTSDENSLARREDKNFARHRNRESARNAQLIARDSSLLAAAVPQVILQIKGEFSKERNVDYRLRKKGEPVYLIMKKRISSWGTRNSHNVSYIKSDNTKEGTDCKNSVEIIFLIHVMNFGALFHNISIMIIANAIYYNIFYN